MDTIADQHARWLADAAAVDRLTKVFVTGVAKSGTTWLKLILNGHPRVVLDGEGAFVWRLLPCLQQGVQAFNQHCRQHKLGPNTEIPGDEFTLAFRQIVLGRLAAYVRAAGVETANLQAVGDKTPQHTLAVGVLAGIFPGAKFVNIVRDPRDAAASAWHHFGKSAGRSIEDHTAWFITEVWRVGVEAVADRSDVLHVRYEDLHAEPTKQVRTILEHLGVDASDADVAACVEAGRFEKHSGGRSRGETNNAHFFRKGVVGDWAETLPEAATERACARVAPLMTRFGYEPAVATAR